jgi:hypothetical protein
MASVVDYHVIDRNKGTQAIECRVTTFKMGKSQTNSYKAMMPKHHADVYEFKIPVEEHWVSGSIKDLIIPPIPKEIVQSKAFPEIFPEVMGSALGGVLATLAAIYAFLTGLASAGIALLGPSLAGFFGAISLWILYRKVEDE